MKKADKLPLIDSRSPDLYRRIVDTAAEVRAERRAESALGWAEIRAKRCEDLARVARREPAEEVILI